MVVQYSTYHDTLRHDTTHYDTSRHNSTNIDKLCQNSTKNKSLLFLNFLFRITKL